MRRDLYVWVLFVVLIVVVVIAIAGIFGRSSFTGDENDLVVPVGGGISPTTNVVDLEAAQNSDHFEVLPSYENVATNTATALAARVETRIPGLREALKSYLNTAATRAVDQMLVEQLNVEILTDFSDFAVGPLVVIDKTLNFDLLQDGVPSFRAIVTIENGATVLEVAVAPLQTV